MKQERQGKRGAEKAQSWKPLRQVFKKNVPWAWYLANLVISMVMGSLFVRLPELTGRIMAGDIFDGGLLAQYMLFTALNAIVGVLYNCSVNWAGYYTERRIQRSLWKKMMHMPLVRYDRQPPSSLISRVTVDTTMATSFLSNVLMLFYLIFTLVMTFLSVLSISSSIGLAVLLVVPYILIVAIVPGRMRYRAAAKRQGTLAKFTSFVAERLSNISLVKSFTAENADLQMGYEIAEENYKADVRFALIDSAAQPFTYIAQAIISCIVLVMGASMVSRGTLGMDGVISLYMYGVSIYSFLIMVVSTFYMFKEVQGATSEIGDIMISEPEKVKREQTLPQAGADISLENVSFGYGDRAVIEEATLTIPYGQVTAIVGPSGAGKTTLLSLLERLYTPREGQIRMGETPAESIHLDEWRGATGYIQQSSPLLGGSIRENISYGLDHTATDEELARASRLANIYGFIQKLPDGFDSDIGQLGGRLSGGERQRIAIARMIIKEPALLLLDEATSDLDAENEAQIQSALNEIMKGRTAVVVAHNLRTIVGADNIIVMDQGRIQAVGTHETLYAENALYRKYIDLQFAG